VLIDHTNVRVLEVLEKREKATLVQWLEQARESGLLGRLEEVTTDMWEGYAQAVAQVFETQVRITIDRFHVSKHFQDCLQQARRQIQKQLPAEAAKALKGTRWLWVTNPENLEAQELAQLQELQQRFPLLAMLSERREALRAIFEDRSITSAAQGRQRLESWLSQTLAAGWAGLERFCKTLKNWIREIANYFVSRASNGRTEGFNRGIRAILWRGFGLPNFAHLRLRILHAFG
jgi:transposase